MENPGVITPAHALCLYCFFKGPPALPSEPGIDEVSPTFILSHQDLCALVSCVPLREYNEEIINTRIRDVKWLAAKVRRHEEIIRAVMRAYPVLPVKFGTLYTSEDRVLQVLRSKYEMWDSFFEVIRDKEEWGVKVYADAKALRRLVANTSVPIQELDRRMSSGTPGAAYLLQRKREQLMQQEARSLYEHLADEIYQAVLSWSVEGKSNRCLSQQATGKTQDMILNAAFLIIRSEVESFKQRIDILAAAPPRNHLLFEISGPWPPYNFCPTLEACQEEASQ